MVDAKKESLVELVTFEFPISDQERVIAIKNIPPSTLPNFYDLVT